MRILIDASGGVLGRIASYAAKQALLGEEIVIVNAEKAIISGKMSLVLEEYLTARKRGGSSQKGPHLPSRPEFIMKRTIRGMLPYKQGRGRQALKRIKCYIGVPEEYAGAKKIEMKESRDNFVTLANLANLIKK